MRILLVEDEIFLSNLMIKQFKQHNITVVSEYNGNAALELINNDYFDLIVLDIMLPGVDGLTILTEMRERNNDTPVIITSAKSSVADKVNALNLGADDYLTKPFDFLELYARIKTNLRRANSVPRLIEESIGDLNYDRDTLTLSNQNNQVKLTLTEFNLFAYLVESNGMPISKEQIIDRIWGYDGDVTVNQVEVYISYLRKKLSLLESSVAIKTQRQVGYFIEVADV